MSETHELFQLRLFFKSHQGGGAARVLCYCWRKADKPAAFAEMIGEYRIGGIKAISAGQPYETFDIAITDDFGNAGYHDVRELESWMVTGTIGAMKMQNEMNLANLRAQMHFNKLVEEDAQLKAFVLRASGRGNIQLPNGGAFNA